MLVIRFPTSAQVHVVVAQLRPGHHMKEMATWTIPDQKGHALCRESLPPPQHPRRAPSSLGCPRLKEVPEAWPQDPGPETGPATPHSEPTPRFIHLFHHLFLASPKSSVISHSLGPHPPSAPLCSHQSLPAAPGHYPLPRAAALSGRGDGARERRAQPRSQGALLASCCALSRAGGRGWGSVQPRWGVAGPGRVAGSCQSGL